MSRARGVLCRVLRWCRGGANDSRYMTPGRRRRSAAGYLKYDVRGAALRNAGKPKDVGRTVAQRSDGVSSARLLIGRAALLPCTARDTRDEETQGYGGLSSSLVWL